MRESALEAARRAYQPPLPPALRALPSLTCLSEGSSSALDHQEEIRKSFPHTYGRGLLRYQKGKERVHQPLRVGVLFSGGQASGGHNVITGLFDALKRLHQESRLFGFLGGPSGLIGNQFVELTEALLAPYRNRGGFDLIGSGRTKIETKDDLERSRLHATERALDGLVIIGGDDSNTNAALLADYFLAHGTATRVVGIPKTIDGDLTNAYVETSFGFDTACKTYAEMVGNITRDALSAKKYYHFIKLMGRSASHIALECALQTHPNLTLIGEEVAAKKATLHTLTDEIADMVCARAAQGKQYGVILMPEGLIEFIPEMKVLISELNTLLAQGVEEAPSHLSTKARATFDFLPPKVATQLLLDRDPHGNVQVSHIDTEALFLHTVKAELKKRSYKGSFSAISHFFGYEGRAALPSNFDATYCYTLGHLAALFIDAGETGYMAFVRHLSRPVEEWEGGGIPLTMLMNLEKRKGKEKPVIRKSLVDLEGAPFQQFTAGRDRWRLDDDYRAPGPIQFFGPPALCDATTLTLSLSRA